MPSIFLGSLCIAAALSASCGAVEYVISKNIAVGEHLAAQRVERANADMEAAILGLTEQVKEADAEVQAAELRLQIEETNRLLGAELAQQLEFYQNRVAYLTARIRQIAHPHFLLGAAPQPGSSVRATVTDFMTRANYPEPIKLAFLHRISQESGFNPQAVSTPGGQYHCLIQWDWNRYHQMLAFTHHRPSRGEPCPDPWTQMAFVHHEMVSNPQFRRLWNVGSRDAYGMVVASYFGGRM